MRLHRENSPKAQQRPEKGVIRILQTKKDVCREKLAHCKTAAVESVSFIFGTTPRKPSIGWIPEGGRCCPFVRLPFAIPSFAKCPLPRNPLALHAKWVQMARLIGGHNFVAELVSLTFGSPEALNFSVRSTPASIAGLTLSSLPS